MPDQMLVCRDCNSQFTFTEGEQEFYKSKGFTPPIRCSNCRRQRKAEKMQSGGDSGFGRRGARGW